MTDEQLRVHNRVGVLRAERGLSRKDLADRLDIHYQTIGFIERGDYRPSLGLALRMAELFQLPVEAIFSLQPLPPLSQQIYPHPGPPTPPTLISGPSARYLQGRHRAGSSPPAAGACR